jgi:hypothetical protein
LLRTVLMLFWRRIRLLLSVSGLRRRENYE